MVSLIFAVILAPAALGFYGLAGLQGRPRWILLTGLIGLPVAALVWLFSPAYPHPAPVQPPLPDAGAGSGFLFIGAILMLASAAAGMFLGAVVNGGRAEIQRARAMKVLSQ